MSDLLHSELFWVAISGAIFVALVYKKISVAAGSRLDDRSDRIRKELDEALALKEEAKKFLADARQKQKNAEDKAKKIIVHAQEESARIIEESQHRADESVAIRRQAAEEKIAAYENAAMADIRRNLLDIATNAVRERLSGHMRQDDEDNAYIERAITSIDHKLH